jgi:hypothetical protein
MDQSASVEQLKLLSNELLAVPGELNDARLYGFLAEALAKKRVVSP